MNIRFEWPRVRPGVRLEQGQLPESGVAFTLPDGAFGPCSGNEEQECIVFYWHLTRPVVRNQCHNHVCLLDGVETDAGSVHPLRNDTRIQAGNFNLIIDVDRECKEDEQTFYRIIYSSGEWDQVNKVPEVEDILPNGGDYTHDLRYFNDVVLALDKGDDVLKTLEVEYKRFLIWQEQEGAYHDAVNYQGDFILKTDNRFDNTREQIKDKTLTECIVGRSFLMEKVWPEMNIDNQVSDIFADDDRVDVLKSLSPEHISAKSKYKVPELVFQDFYKIGLDSHF